MELDLLPLTRALALAGLFLGACGGAAPPPAAPPPAEPVARSDEASATPSATADAPPAEAAPSVAPPPDSSTTPPVEPAPLPEGTRVLHIGDSMAGALGLELNRQLKEQGVKSTLRFETSSYIPTWAWGDTLPQALAQVKPDLVIVTLGMNELKIADPGQRAKTVRRLVERLGDRPCVWISPPPLASGTNELPTVIRDNCPPCAFMNTDEVYPDMPRLGDKVHPTMPARAEWARRVIRWLAERRDQDGDRPWAFRAGVVGSPPDP